MSDKTNGTPLFVKYKILLGTLILSVTASSANAMEKRKIINDSIPPKPDRAEITCYKPAIPIKEQSSPESIEIKGRVLDENREPLIGVSVTVKNKKAFGTSTDESGYFKLKAERKDTVFFSYIGYKTKEFSVSIVVNNGEIIMMEETILCYDMVVVTTYKDDVYKRIPKRITKLSYTEIQIPPISPVGDLDSFQNWINENVRYDERMLQDKIEGEVILSFAIDKKGKIVDKKVIGKLSPDADKEALRILTSSMNWKPGEYNGKKIKTTMVVTVSFRMPK